MLVAPIFLKPLTVIFRNGSSPEVSVRCGALCCPALWVSVRAGTLLSFDVPSAVRQDRAEHTFRSELGRNHLAGCGRVRGLCPAGSPSSTIIVVVSNNSKQGQRVSFWRVKSDSVEKPNYTEVCYRYMEIPFLSRCVEIWFRWYIR